MYMYMYMHVQGKDVNVHVHVFKHCITVFTYSKMGVVQEVREGLRELPVAAFHNFPP